MAVTFACPRCGQSARIVSGGHVEAHEATPGEPCTYTKTPSSGGVRDKESAEVRANRAAQRRAEDAEKAAARAAQKARAAESREKAEAARLEQKRRTAASRVECPRCHALVLPSKMSPTGLVAHTRPSGRWCKGGAEPSGKQGKVKRSVWPVSGGLPGLGRR
ncbi:hypothetical protein [Microbacterium sp. p3-SID336]|uniref:hypothetical protein n=1 Tax=Microbacterium sp. p3-SID336 TaxID=2916212 RepID=UPI0021A428D5|nr:hypothetical protein [Microbacterium sp. p3-SID336]MCT1476508.1 hypothetical protein [Microbacterium sp. p3-SID336]